MVELAGTGSGDCRRYQEGLGGDSYNTAIYLAREGLQVDYLTRLAMTYSPTLSPPSCSRKVSALPQ
jgi:hypothetical protein